MCLCIMMFLLPPLLRLRRRFRLVANLLSAMIRDGVSLARSVELAVRWDAILRVGAHSSCF